MKTSLFIAGVFIFTIFFYSCGNETKKNSEESVSAEMINNPITADGDSGLKNLPAIKFEKTEHDFGILLQGEKVSYTFKFKNIGKKELIVKEASASCGCTVPKYSQKPIAPGEEGELEVIFDSKNRTGRQIKTITVWTNCQPNQTKLQIVSEIVVPK